MTGEGSTAKPFNLDAAVAERQVKEPFPFEFAGEDFTLPGEVDLRAVAALDAERLDQGFKLLLGPDQWERLQAVDQVFGNAHFEALVAAYRAHLDADVGESDASATSSPDTASA